ATPPNLGGEHKRFSLPFVPFCGYFRVRTPNMSDSTINLLRDLIAIDSVNPSLVPGAAGEAQIAAAIAAKLGSGGMDVQLQQVAPGRSNVIGVLDSRQRGQS